MHTPRPLSHTRALRAVRAGAALPLFLLLGSCQRNAASDVALGQEILDLGDAVSGVRQQNADLQEQVDALRATIARQDTAVQKLNAAIAMLQMQLSSR